MIIPFLSFSLSLLFYFFFSFSFLSYSLFFLISISPSFLCSSSFALHIFCSPSICRGVGGVYVRDWGCVWGHLSPWTPLLMPLASFFFHCFHYFFHPLDIDLIDWFYFNPRPTMGGPPPPNGFFRSPQNTNQCGLRLLGNCLFIFCAHFEEKNLGVPPSPGVGYSVKVQG